MPTTPLVIRFPLSETKLDVGKVPIGRFLQFAAYRLDGKKQRFGWALKNDFPASNQKSKTTFIWQVPPCYFDFHHFH